MPTELGELVIEQMEQFFPEILNVEFTANMEEDLDHVEEGSEDWVKVLAEFYESFEKRLEVAEEEMKEIEIEDEVSDEICEKCGKPLVYKLGRFGKFLACSGFPDCRNTKPIVKDIGVSCPKCKEGHVVERRSKKGRVFFGCDRYPECDFVSWDKPSTKPCPNCSSLMVEKKASKASSFSVPLAIIPKWSRNRTKQQICKAYRGNDVDRFTEGYGYRGRTCWQ